MFYMSQALLGWDYTKHNDGLATIDFLSKNKRKFGNITQFCMSQTVKGGLCALVCDARVLYVYHCFSKEIIMKLKLKKEEEIIGLGVIDDDVIFRNFGLSLPKEVNFALSEMSKIPLFCIVKSNGFI